MVGSVGQTVKRLSHGRRQVHRVVDGCHEARRGQAVCEGNLVVIDSLPSQGTLKVGGVTQTTAPFTVLAANLSQLTFTPAPTQTGSPYTSILFQVKDDGLTANGGIDLDPAQRILTFNVLPVYPLDGGQILRSLLWFGIGRARSLQVACIIGFIGLPFLAWWGVGRGQPIIRTESSSAGGLRGDNPPSSPRS